MRRRIGLVVLLAVLLCSLMLPYYTIHTHMKMDAELASAFPESLSGWDVALKGVGALPTNAMPSLHNIDLRGFAIVLGVVLFALATLLFLIDKPFCRHIALALSVASTVMFLYVMFHLNMLAGTMMLSILLTPKIWIWIPVALSLAQAVIILVSMKGEKRLPVGDIAWRRAAGILCLMAALLALLPAVQTGVTDTLTEDARDHALASRSRSLVEYMLDSEPSLNDLRQSEGAFQNVLSGDIAQLATLSDDASNIKGAFIVTTRNHAFNAILMMALFLLVLSGALYLIPSVDRWFPACLSALSAVLLITALPSLLSIDASTLFTGATTQLMYLGLGYVTLFPILLLLLALGGAALGVLSIRYADDPYFVNPVPENRRLRLTAALLAFVALVMMLLPEMSISYYKPGKTKVQSTQTITGLEAITFQQKDAALHPVDTRGKLIYSDEAKEGVMTAQAVEDTISGVLTTHSAFTIASMLLLLAALVLLLTGSHQRKLMISLLLLCLALRAASWITASNSLPKVIGAMGFTMYFYVSLPLLGFAAFFANFADKSELPNKFKLFLMMLPFLVAVFLFSYLPLYGWSYAFFNYKFGFPMSEQEFVGFKWFLEIVNNVGQRTNMIRVMKNTFGISGLNLLTSWMPMAFAILLNEISRGRYKKFVQIFTTLPNFISWALVFSFAMALFSLDTGVYNKLLLNLGIIQEPVAWLNSSTNIWVKMWGWSTWKGLGWGAIMYLAAIAGIDQELYEAARVDGAGRWKQILHITIPGLLPTFFVLLLLSISNIVNNGMEQYLVFQNSMNKDTIEVLDLYVFNITIASKGTTMYSFGTAIGILKTLFSVTMLFLANFASKKLRGESIV